jgi:hypothetical protein
VGEGKRGGGGEATVLKLLKINGLLGKVDARLALVGQYPFLLALSREEC